MIKRLLTTMLILGPWFAHAQEASKKVDFSTISEIYKKEVFRYLIEVKRTSYGPAPLKENEEMSVRAFSNAVEARIIDLNKELMKKMPERPVDDSQLPSVLQKVNNDYQRIFPDLTTDVFRQIAAKIEKVKAG